MTLRALLLTGVLVLPAHALADSKAEAKQHLDRATQLHKDGKLAESLDELKTAFALDPQPQLLFAMGQIHVQLGQCAQAITYYERFLATKPSGELARVTNEAIEACKTNPPPAVEPTKPEPATPEPPPEPTPPPPPPQPQPVAAPAVHAEASSPFYADVIGDGLVVAGVAAGAVGYVFYRGAVSDRSHADSAPDYQMFSSLIDSAHTKQNEALVLGAASAALITIGAVHFVLHRDTHHDVAIVPRAGGGSVVWTGRF